MPLDEMKPSRRGGGVADAGSYPVPHIAMPLVGLGTEPALAAAMTQPEEETQRTPLKRSASFAELELTPSEHKAASPPSKSPLGTGPSDVNADNTSPTKGADPQQAPEQVAPIVAPNSLSAAALGMHATAERPKCAIDMTGTTKAPQLTSEEIQNLTKMAVLAAAKLGTPLL